IAERVVFVHLRLPIFLRIKKSRKSALGADFRATTTIFADKHRYVKRLLQDKEIDHTPSRGG
ncbi:MAG: hypothetical protein K6G15_06005, partial [Desulfovibrio sp.]|nr:hypothetical protein [Desulfovibrio sp.]